MKYEKIAEYSNAKFRRITGVKRATFDKMVEILRKGNVYVFSVVWVFAVIAPYQEERG